jgi:hypothetical protein
MTPCHKSCVAQYLMNGGQELYSDSPNRGILTEECVVKWPQLCMPIGLRSSM